MTSHRSGTGSGAGTARWKGGENTLQAQVQEDWRTLRHEFAAASDHQSTISPEEFQRVRRCMGVASRSSVFCKANSSIGCLVVRS